MKYNDRQVYLRNGNSVKEHSVGVCLGDFAKNGEILSRCFRTVATHYRNVTNFVSIALKFRSISHWYFDRFLHCRPSKGCYLLIAILFHWSV